jgi:serine/threonine protein kinase
MGSDDVAEAALAAGRYRLLRPLGRGGMGTVWAAEDELLQRPVAVKEVRYPDYLSEEDRALLRERTLREARTAARLDHSCAVRVFDVWDEADRAFLVMELLDGRSLADLVRSEGPLPSARVAEIGSCVADALAAAHAAGIVHRDVKPGNVMVRDNGRVALTDFGIAAAAGDASITSTGLLIGSPAYIAPERANGGGADPAGDVWSLGATLYAAVEGQPPFDRGQPIATLTAVVSQPHEPCRRAAPALAAMIDELLQKDPTLRPSAEEARQRLAAIATGGTAPLPALTPAVASPIPTSPAPTGSTPTGSTPTGSTTTGSTPTGSIPTGSALVDAASPAPVSSAGPADLADAGTAATPYPAPPQSDGPSRAQLVLAWTALGGVIFVVSAVVAALVAAR